jgi:hypothetical protein
MITTTTASCISVIYMITEIQGAIVVVIIWWCDLQLNMSYITEIQGAVVVVIIWWCDLQLHMSCITAPFISVIHDIWSCKSHQPYDHDHDGLLYFSNIWHM